MITIKMANLIYSLATLVDPLHTFNEMYVFKITPVQDYPNAIWRLVSVVAQNNLERVVTNAKNAIFHITRMLGKIILSPQHLNPPVASLAPVVGTAMCLSNQYLTILFPLVKYVQLVGTGHAADPIP